MPMANTSNNTGEFCSKFLKSKTEEDKMIKVITCVLNFCFSFGTVTLNGSIVFCIAKSKQLHSTYNFFLLNMCVACLLIGGINQMIAGILHISLNVNHCWIFKLISLNLTIVPSLALCVVLLERYLKVFHPLHCQQFLSYQGCIILTLLTWIIPVTTSVASSKLKSGSKFAKLRLILKLFASVHLTGIIWITFINIKTTLLVRSIQKEIRDQQAKFKVTRSTRDVNKAVWFTVVCIITFVICYLPFSIAIFIPNNQVPRRLWPAVVSLLNFCANITPVSVIRFHKDIRQQLSSSFRCNVLSKLWKSRDPHQS